MSELGQLKVLDKHGKDITEHAVNKLQRSPTERQRRRAADFLMQRCGYTREAAESAFDKPKL